MKSGLIATKYDKLLRCGWKHGGIFGGHMHIVFEFAVVVCFMFFHRSYILLFQFCDCILLSLIWCAASAYSTRDRDVSFAVCPYLAVWAVDGLDRQKEKIHHRSLSNSPPHKPSIRSMPSSLSCRRRRWLLPPLRHSLYLCHLISRTCQRNFRKRLPTCCASSFIAIHLFSIHAFVNAIPSCIDVETVAHLVCVIDVRVQYCMRA